MPYRRMHISLAQGLKVFSVKPEYYYKMVLPPLVRVYYERAADASVVEGVLDKIF